jgi:hypothetical protein
MAVIQEIPQIQTSKKSHSVNNDSTAQYYNSIESKSLGNKRTATIALVELK